MSHFFSRRIWIAGLLIGCTNLSIGMADEPVKKKAIDGPIFPIQQNGMWGFIDVKGEIVVEPKFSSELNEPRFSNGFAVVQARGRQAWISEQGTFVVPKQKVSVLRGFSDGLFKVNVGQRITMGDILADPGLWGFMDKTGTMTIPASFVDVGHFSEGLCSAGQPPPGERRSKWGYIDTKGKWVIEPKYNQAQAFFDGLAFVGVALPGERFVKQGAINKAGEMVIKPQFEQARSFRNSIAAVRKDGKWAYIKKDGSAICKFDYEAVEPMVDDIGQVWKWEKDNKGRLVNTRCGYMNKDGKLITELKFASGYSFADGMAAVQVDGKMGFVNTAGEIAVKPQYSSVGAYSEGLVAVQVGKKYGYIDKQGKTVIEPQFEFGQPFTNGLARVFVDKANRKYAYVNKQGKIVFQYQTKPVVVRF